MACGGFKQRVNLAQKYYSGACGSREHTVERKKRLVRIVREQMSREQKIVPVGRYGTDNADEQQRQHKLRMSERRKLYRGDGGRDHKVKHCSAYAREHKIVCVLALYNALCLEFADDRSEQNRDRGADEEVKAPYILGPCLRSPYRASDNSNWVITGLIRKDSIISSF